MKRTFVDIDDFEDSDEEKDEGDRKKFQNKTEATIYLIDGRKKMFSKSSKDDQTPFLLCLQGVRNAIRGKIFRSGKCFCSIILLGTKKTENPLKLDNIFVLKDLELLGAEHILKIDETIKAVENSTYDDEFGCDKFSLGDAFWLSTHIFNQRSRNLNKSIILFTNDDNPISNDKSDERRAITSAQLMFESVITFDLIPVGRDFDVDKFFKKIIMPSQNVVECVIPDPVENVDEIVSRISKKNYRHVTLVKLPFVISDDFIIGVSVHYLVRKAKVPFKTKLTKATNEVVITKMQHFEEETGSLVKAEDLIKSQAIGQKDIEFSTTELKAISEIGKSEMRLLGFKPASVISLENFVQPCAFIYPEESLYKGSSVFFTALLKRCIAKQVVPICTFCPRPTSSCRFVALMAQDEFLRDDKTQELPPGFVVFFLPFAEEVRTYDDKITQRAEPEQVDLAMKFIKKLKFNYKVECFRNPKLKAHWAAIEALALDLKEPEEVTDCTIPDYDLISRRSGNLARQFIESVYSEDYEPEDFSAPKKPKPLPKAKTVGDIENVEKLVTQGRGVQLSNDVLKEYLKSIGEGKGLSKMKKADLLEKVRNHLHLT